MFYANFTLKGDANGMQMGWKEEEVVSKKLEVRSR